MRLRSLELCGFRGYKNHIKIDFGTDFTIVDGRNGVGKSTIFDAVEFALTGTIAKYPTGKADKETVDDYIWWRGEEVGPVDRFVTVCFENDEKEFSVTRTSLSTNEPENLINLANLLCDIDARPAAALEQLCASSIIRDELIAALSLDLKESERYDLLSSAIGVTGADDWIAKAEFIYKQAKERLKSVETQASIIVQHKASISRELDDVRASLLDDQQSRSASIALRKELQTRVAPESMADEARKEVSRLTLLVARYESLQTSLDQKTVLENKIAECQKSLEDSQALEKEKTAELIDLSDSIVDVPAGDLLASKAEKLAALAQLGEDIGCDDLRCPLCNSDVTKLSFSDGVSTLRDMAEELNSESVRITRQRETIKSLRSDVEKFKAAIEVSKVEIRNSKNKIEEILREWENLLPDVTLSRENLLDRSSRLSKRIETIKGLIPFVDTGGKQSRLRRVEAKMADISDQEQQSEARLATARRAVSNTKALFDGVRRASGEALTLRLERILPLITELYSRLRPHPSFETIEYKMRGELRKYLTFRVGYNINPQFVYSSGQRRATGLAFLVSVNLSIAWSKWQSLLLDDPVQHIDDFRSIHLAELLGHLVNEQRQIICAVEDSALAELICRKMPIRSENAGKRITLGLDAEGDVAILSERSLSHTIHRVLNNNDQVAIG